MLPRSGDPVSPSLWSLARGGEPDATVIGDYLSLLRASNQSVRIADIHNARSSRPQDPTTGKSVTIVPFQDDENWAYAVIYPDCIHWFDSRGGIPVPSFLSQRGDINLERGWSAPSQTTPEESGLFLLLGIRLITDGRGCLHQPVAGKTLTDFRTRVLIELLTQKLNPDDRAVQAILDSEEEEQSAFFNAAMPLEYDHQPSDSQTDPWASLESSRASSVERGGTGETQELRAEPPRSPPLARDTPLDDRKIILRLMCDAVALSRSTKPSATTGLAMLWSSVKGNMSGEFHRRLNGVLFRQKMSRLKGIRAISEAMNYDLDRSYVKEMRSVQYRFRFWEELCSLRQDWGDSKFTLLCTVPRGESVENRPREQQDAMLAGIRRRLDDPSDPLSYYLEQARGLCESLLSNRLPPTRLLIDLYPYKAGQDDLTDAEYGAFVSLDPHAKIPTAR
ncbi:hypothetical protein NKR23_g12312 [Pleurostoma richardsiae]|uniref:Uncharacterized protein n=1 Tax=Pleurostoma richardsiae TaxID=41990 RepID=A0AA38R7X2_9PEZI|nr:hypothetical protein NKR23_g12312 [Pleurostoma richardsiae]